LQSTLSALHCHYSDIGLAFQALFPFFSTDSFVDNELTVETSYLHAEAFTFFYTVLRSAACLHGEISLRLLISEKM
jgi:hypothetical protein